MDETRKTRTEHKNRYFFDAETTLRFIAFLKGIAPVIAPHKKGEASWSFEVVTDVNDVVYDYPRTIQPLKKLFAPPKETLLRFNLEKNDYQKQDIQAEKRFFFAVHSYEMESVRRLDYSFSTGNPESNYLLRREEALFIGIDFQPDQWHFCQSVGINIDDMDGFCLYFMRSEAGFIVFEVNEDGADLLSRFGAGDAAGDEIDAPQKESVFSTRIKNHYNRLSDVLSHSYGSKVWDEVAKKCVGCGTCNLLCPTCYCFDVRDEVELNAVDGSRQRFWDGCMLNNFAEVAGGENFRPARSARTRHRLHRKFKYITDVSGVPHCVGCGRCSKYCPVDISIVEIVNRLIDETTNKGVEY